jgi:hypothetical protein
LENVATFYGRLEYFTGIWDILWPSGTFIVHLLHFPVLVSGTKKNLATLKRDQCHDFPSGFVHRWNWSLEEFNLKTLPVRAQAAWRSGYRISLRDSRPGFESRNTVVCF